MIFERLLRRTKKQPQQEPKSATVEEPKIDNLEVEALVTEVDSWITSRNSRTETVSALADTDPWRGLAMLGHVDLMRSQLYPEYSMLIEKVDTILRKKQIDSLLSVRQRLVKCFLEIERVSTMLQEKIKSFEKYLTQNHNGVRTERGVEHAFVTIHQIEEMNRRTFERPLNTWNTDMLRAMDLESYTRYVEQNGSGRYFLHAFPEISIQNGHIANGYGGDSLMGGYKTMRDKGGAINFVPDEGDRHPHQFYIQFGNVGGGVYYPAEVILENYSFINLPYQKDPTFVSSEWRIHGAGDVNPSSRTNVIPLNLGVCFFSEDDRETIEAWIEKLPPQERPNKIVYHKEGSSAGWREYSKRLNPPNEQLPKIAKPIIPIANYDGTMVFGTQGIAKDWREKQITQQTIFG